MNAPANPLLMRAIDAHKGGRLAEAEAAYRRVLRKRPDDADALNFLGMLRVQSGDVAQGREFLSRSVRSAPRNPHAWTNLGNALMASGELEGASKAFSTATQLAPTMAEAWFNRGVCSRRLKQAEDALSCFRKAVEHGPGYAAAYEAMASLLYRANRHAEAADAYRKWLQYEPDNPVARHMLAATSGEAVPARAGDEYLQHLFDAFSDTFDENLQELGYRAPQLLAAAAAEKLAGRSGLDILDAGCGTGLCGPLLRSMARTLIGVDISTGMLEKARARGSYDELAAEELSTFMRKRPASVDVVLSADTLVYFGELDEPLAAAYACLRSGGLIAFTLERLDDAADAPFRIEPHGRYSHQESYVRAALQRAGFPAAAVTADTLRREKGQDVAGHVVLATK